MTTNLLTSVAQGLRIQLLGGFTVWVGHQRIPESAWRLRRAKILIKMLALTSGHSFHREELMDLLWRDADFEPKAAANNFHQVLHVARRTLETAGGNSSGYLSLQGDVISLCPQEPLEIDVEAFEGAVAQARQSQDPAAYQAALDLYTGDLLPDEDLYEDWTANRREILRQKYLSLLIELARLYESQKAYTLALDTLGRVLNSDPAHEVAHRSTMYLYALTGQRPESLRQYQRLRETLKRELDAEPEQETQHLYQDILASRFSLHSAVTQAKPVEPPARPVFTPRPEYPARKARDAPPHNLPFQLTNFIGREWEMDQVKRLLTKARLLTLTGAGGCGKTRLALEVAASLGAEYADGVFVVQLAALSDPSLVPQAVASALGVYDESGRPLQAILSAYLQPRQLLLVLDNCEHLVEACAQLATELLLACPKLRILATSREALRTTGESVWNVPSLATPDPRHLPPAESLMQYEAVQLFIDRALLVQPGFVLTKQNGPSVARICHRLDGIPLAIEMATGRLRVLSLGQISERLDNSFQLLIDGSRVALPHHRTLRAAVDWSYELLSELEQLVFNRLSVFSGGFTLEAVEAVCSNESIGAEQVLDILFQLVEKSLVSVEEGLQGAVRYQLLETLRQYGQERLEKNGETKVTQQWHAAFFLALAEKAEQELRGPEQQRWLNVLDKEHDNLRAALTWLAESGEAEAGLRLAGALYWFWRVRGYFAEGLRWLEGAILRSKGRWAAARVKALNGAATLAWDQSEYDRATVFLEESLALSREVADQRGSAYALYNLGNLAYTRGDYRRAVAFLEESLVLSREVVEQRNIAVCLNLLGSIMREQRDYHQATALLEEGLALCRELGDQRAIARSLSNLGLVAQYRGDYHQALALFGESLVMFRELADQVGIADTLGNLGLVYQYLGDYRQAVALLSEGLTLFWKLGHKLGITECIEGLAQVASSQGQFQQATRLFGAGEALRTEIGASLPAAALAQYERNVATARDRLGQETFAAAWAWGVSVTLERAVEYALESVLA
jgi:predicted ATPase/DNA-binding SARP family transcriptional activator